MNNLIEIIKGIHPGKFIERELKKKSLTQRVLAEETAIPFQTINAIITGRRNITTEQALKIDHALGFEDGFFAILQTHYDIKQYKEKELASLYAEAPRIRKSLFWDADFGKINWGKYKDTVIRRVLERGNKEETEEIQKFYGLSKNELRQYLRSIRFRKQRENLRKDGQISL
jgi:addiction module HigA family antidote